jgi:hypothetical protein
MPAIRDGGCVQHIGHQVPVMFTGIASYTPIKPMMSGRESQQDISFLFQLAIILQMQYFHVL